MGDKTKIEWTDASWNPVRGCTKVSPGCDNCYAMTVAHRFSGHGQPYEGLTRVIGGRGQWNGEVMLVPRVLDQPIRWQKPRRIFVNSMSDLFHPGVPDEFIDRVFATMALAPHHTFQVLTKRPERMREYLNSDFRLEAVSLEAVEADPDRSQRLPDPFPWPLPNVWLGVSVENQVSANERIPPLLETLAAVRWLSCEPLLGPVSLLLRNIPSWDEDWVYDTLAGLESGSPRDDDPHQSPHLDWVVVGGESGPGSRPMHPDWARLLRDQCQKAGVPFLFKQWGDWLPSDQPGAEALMPFRGPVHTWEAACNDPSNESPGLFSFRIPKQEAGRLLDGMAFDEYPTPLEARKGGGDA